MPNDCNRVIIFVLICTHTHLILIVFNRVVVIDLLNYAYVRIC